MRKEDYAPTAAPYLLLMVPRLDKNEEDALTYVPVKIAVWKDHLVLIQGLDARLLAPATLQC